MLLKIRSNNGWEMVSGIDKAEYGGPESKTMGVYVNKTNPTNPILVPVKKYKSPTETWYYPNDNDVSITLANESHGEPENVKIHGRSALESAYSNVSKDDIHDEDVVFMSWLRDSKTGEVFLFDDAFLLNDNGKTIERIS